MTTPQLPNKPVGGDTATLTDGKTTYSFLLAPEVLQWSYQANYAVNSVLDTSNPDVRWQSSSNSLSLPRVLFVSQGMTQDVSPALDQLMTWTATGATLKFVYGSTVLNRCHIARFAPKEQQWRSGKCTQAEASLDLIIAREPVVITTSTSKVTTVYTPRERENLAAKVVAAVKNKAIADKLKVPQGSKATVSEDGFVTITKPGGGVAGNFKVSDLKSQGVIK